MNVLFLIKIFIIETYLRLRLLIELKQRQDVLFVMRHFRFMDSPYRQASSYYRSLGMDPYVYGETPLWTVYQIFNQFKDQKDLKVLDLGAGNFQISFFLRKFFGYTVYGVEKVPIFCEQAKALKAQLSIDHLEIVEGDYLKEALPIVDVAFLFGSNLDDQVILQLIEKIVHIPKVITVSFPLSDYHASYSVVKEMNLPFIFGNTTVYINQKNN